VQQASEQLATYLADEAATVGELPDDLWERFDRQLERSYQRDHPGYGAGRMQFPPSQILALLVGGGRPGWLTQAEAVLEAMQDAGIHDRVGGGFHRYSTQPDWRLPHFEKMLYDNAQLMGVYARAGVALARADFLRTAMATGDYLLRDLRVVHDGVFQGYACAEDADDAGGEGAFYAWSPQALVEILGQEDGTRLAAEWALYPGEPEPGAPGHPGPVLGHIPHPRGADLPAGEPGQQRRAAWEIYFQKLREMRNQRPRPGRDDKVLTDQNALALEGYALLGRYTGEARFIAATRELAGVLIARQQSDGLNREIAFDVERPCDTTSGPFTKRVNPHNVRSSSDLTSNVEPRTSNAPSRLKRLVYTKGSINVASPAYITDYGAMVAGLMAAFDLLGDPHLVHAAERIADEAVARLRAEDGGFFTTPAGRTDLVRRGRETLDNAWPAGQNTLALGLVRLWNVTGAVRWRTLAEGIIATSANSVSQAPTATATLLRAWRQLQAGHATAVVTGPAGDAQVEGLLTASRRALLPHLAIVPASACAAESWECLAALRGVTTVQAQICVGTTCLAPARSPEEVKTRFGEIAR
jgi:uncharacterized protein YyaL (SSP411 family)